MAEVVVRGLGDDDDDAIGTLAIEDDGVVGEDAKVVGILGTGSTLAEDDDVVDPTVLSSK